AAVDEGGELQAAGDRAAVEQHGAAAAQALAAALARAEEVELVAQHLHEAVVRLDDRRDGLAVEGEVDGSRGHVGRPAHSSSSGLPALARSARYTASGVSGSSVSRTPTASSIALAIAGDTPKVALSPTPLAPNGPECWIASTVSLVIGGMSA